MLTETLTKLKKLLEDSKKRVFKTEEEEALKEYLMEILINENGEYGPYRHPKYAQRLEKLIVRIVPLVKPKGYTGTWVQTAAISFDEGIIYINRGFLTGTDEETKCAQLNVLIRHEIAHNLLMHQIRMLKKFAATGKGEKFSTKMSMSSMLHSLLNIIMDFEISNRKYTSDDKTIVKNMTLAGRLIGGLVTEMHRADWMKMSLEEMYEALLADLKTVRAGMDFYIERGYHKSEFRDRLEKEDMLTLEGMGIINQYANTEKESIIWLPIEEYFKKSKVFKNKFAKSFQDYFKLVYEQLKDLPQDVIQEMIYVVARSQPFEEADISSFGIEHDDVAVLYTPEEKFIFQQVAKALVGIAKERPVTKVKKAEHSDEYKKGYNEVIKKLGKRSAISEEDLIAVCAALGISLM